jgi:hypothetical protein
MNIFWRKKYAVFCIKQIILRHAIFTYLHKILQYSVWNGLYECTRGIDDGKWMPGLKILWYGILSIWFFMKNNLMCFIWTLSVSATISRSKIHLTKKSLSDVTLRCYEIMFRIFRWMVFLHETLGGQN